jgi:hypothetical protein
MIAAFSAAHLAACLEGNAAPDDPCFDDCYIRDCLTLLDMIERGATVAELAAYDAASEGVFDGWQDWFCRTLAQLPPNPAYGRALEAFQGVGATYDPKTWKGAVRA